jgi:hypothetical protein
MRAMGRAFRSLAQMLLTYLQKKRQLKEQTARGDVQMPASIQLIT